MAFNIVLRKCNGFSESVMDYFKTWAPWFKMMRSTAKTVFVSLVNPQCC